MRAVATSLVLLTATGGAANAHDYGPLAPDEILGAWHPDIVLTLTLLALAQAYALGRVRLHRRIGRTAVPAQLAIATYAGLASLWVALVSPLEALTGTLLAAHMTQHVILIAIAPPLLLAGRPGVVVTLLLPHRARRLFQRAHLGELGVFIARPVPAALLHGVVLWVWHAPPLFQSAMQSEALHYLEHAAFFLTALLFWHAVLRAARAPSRRIEGIAAIVVTLIQGGLLGALLTLAGRPLFGHGAETLAWGLTPLADQQLAGLVMWVPAGAVYLLAGCVIALRLVGAGATAPPAAHRR